jgi:hypothetical protein
MIGAALAMGLGAIGPGIDRVYELSKIDPWFLAHIQQIIDFENTLIAEAKQGKEFSAITLRKAKEYGFSDAQLAKILGKTEIEVRKMRKEKGITATFKLVDTCAAEFEAYTPYFYSTYESEDEAASYIREADKSGKKKIMILGGGPNRIGQGIEFDYCCCHAASGFSCSSDMGGAAASQNCRRNAEIPTVRKRPSPAFSRSTLPSGCVSVTRHRPAPSV